MTVPDNNPPSVEDRLRILEDRLAIMDLEAEYAVAWDRGEANRWAAVFTPDGAFEMLPVGERPVRRIEGREALRAFCSETTARWTGLHFMHRPQLTLEGDRARGIVYFEYPYIMRGVPEIAFQGRQSGYYEVVYQRTAVGWRMRERLEKGVVTAAGTYFDTPAPDPTKQIL